MRLWKQELSLDEVNGWAPNTMIGTLGIRIIEIGDDFVRGTLPVDARTHQPYGLLHGGASVALAETLGTMAAMLCIDPTKEAAVGLDINANHLRAVTTGVVTGTARPIHVGRTTQVWGIRIEDARARLVCISRLTVAVVPRQVVPHSAG
jgi:1,4-dihydroxy-2-naphthoyl-CoA hydrolase